MTQEYLCIDTEVYHLLLQSKVSVFYTIYVVAA